MVVASARKPLSVFSVVRKDSPAKGTSATESGQVSGL
jgi:hypothetical protein